MTKNRFWGIVPAAGVGKRMQSDRPKQYLHLADMTVIEHALSRLLQSNLFQGIVVAVSEDDPYWPTLAIARHPAIIRAAGGTERADSVLSALIALSDFAEQEDWVLVHDAARPCITVQDIHTLVNELQNSEVGGILALSSHDTLKNVDRQLIVGTLDRTHIWRALTPQMFRYGMLLGALKKAKGNPCITDESSALELQGWQPNIVEGRPDNIKITRPEDLSLARFYLEQQ